MIFCQSARVHIPEAMTKSFGRVWVIRQKICEEVPARAKNQEEREEKKEVFVASETHSKKKNEREEKKNLLFALRFFSSTPRTQILIEFCCERLVFHQSWAFSFLFSNPLGKKKTRVFTRSRTIETIKVKKNTRARWKKERVRAFSPIFTSRERLITRKQSAFYGHIFLVFFKTKRKVFFAFRRRKKKEALTHPPEFLSLALSSISHLFQEKSMEI